MFPFVNKYLKCDDREKLNLFSRQAFNRGNVLNLYFSDEKTGNSDLTVAGVYPGPINNFSITQFKNFWFDPDSNQSHTNTYLKKGIKENVDFLFMNERGWNSVKDVFGCDFEIKRKIPNVSANQLIEVNLRKVFTVFIS